MLFVFSFLVIGGTTLLIDQVGLWLLLAIAVAVVGGYAYAIVSWVNNSIGVTLLINSSWRWLSGAATPNDVWNHDSCTSYGGLLTGLAAFLVLWITAMALLFVGFIPAFVAILGIPAGLFATGGGALVTLVTGGKERSPLFIGLMILTTGLCGMLLTGIMLRIVHVITGALPCVN